MAWIYLILALSFLAVISVVCVVLSIKHRAHKKSKQRSDVGKIMRTTDGYFAGNSANRKKRNVVVLAQRKDDGALAVVKLHRKQDKHTNILKRFLLRARKHPALTADSVTETRVYVGNKTQNPITKGDLTDTGDKLTWWEKFKLKRRAGGNTRKHRRTTRRKLKRWRKHFKK